MIYLPMLILFLLHKFPLFLAEPINDITASTQSSEIPNHELQVNHIEQPLANSQETSDNDKTAKPSESGKIGAFSILIDMFIVISLTALVISFAMMIVFNLRTWRSRELNLGKDIEIGENISAIALEEDLKGEQKSFSQNNLFDSDYELMNTEIESNPVEVDCPTIRDI